MFHKKQILLRLYEILNKQLCKNYKKSEIIGYRISISREKQVIIGIDIG